MADLVKDRSRRNPKNPKNPKNQNGRNAINIGMYTMVNTAPYRTISRRVREMIHDMQNPVDLPAEPKPPRVIKNKPVRKRSRSESKKSKKSKRSR
jgi:small-conductance mechanosensitive channel